MHIHIRNQQLRLTQRLHLLARRVNSVTSNLVKVVILANNDVTVKTAFNNGKCSLKIKFSINSSVLGDFVPIPRVGASPLDPTGGFPSPDSLN